MWFTSFLIYVTLYLSYSSLDPDSLDSLNVVLNMDKNDSIPSDFCFWKAPVQIHFKLPNGYNNKLLQPLKLVQFCQVVSVFRYFFPLLFSGFYFIRHHLSVLTSQIGVLFWAWRSVRAFSMIVKLNQWNCCPVLGDKWKIRFDFAFKCIFKSDGLGWI